MSREIRYIQVKKIKKGKIIKKKNMKKKNNDFDKSADFNLRTEKFDFYTLKSQNRAKY